jgi:hypothetical protein
MSQLKAKSYADFKKGIWNSVSESLAPEDSVKFALNMNSDEILGDLISRKGQTLVRQTLEDKTCLGLHDFRDSVGSGSKLFSVFSDGTNSDVYDTVAGTKSLEDDTKDLDTNFLTFLDSCLRLNGTDAPKAWNGSAWVTTGGAFDLGNLPSGSKSAIEFKDRVYVIGRTDNPDRVDISGIANSTTRAISWTVDNKFILAEQEDGGGKLTAISKVPGYVLLFKKRTLKRYDGSSAYPEDMVNQGAPSQKAVVVAKGICFWVNENGIWASTGGDPKKISSNTVEGIVRSCSATDLLRVCAGTDEEHIFFSFPSVTIDGEVKTNVVLKYNILQTSWDARQYPTFISCFTKFVDTDGAVYVVVGDSNGNVLKLDTGTDDNGTAIEWALTTKDETFGFRMFQKGISRIGVWTEDVSNGVLLWRSTSKPEDWKFVGEIDRELSVMATDLRAVKYNFKLTGTTDSSRAIIKAIEFPAGTALYENE